MIAKRLFLLFILTGIGLGMLQAQEKILHGRIFTFDSIPLSGVSITVRSSGEVYYSDSIGSFTVKCLSSDRLKTEARGFSSEKIRIEDPARYVLINMTLKPGPKNLDLAVGYGHVKDSDKLYAITQLNKDHIDFSQYKDIYEILRTQFSGVQVDANNNIIVRGINSMGGSNTSMGSNSALIVVDGIVIPQSSLNMISTNDIASVKILKDASAAVYGARGANGVVVIETKRGNIQ